MGWRLTRAGGQQLKQSALPLGKSNDDHPMAGVEIYLAKLLAESAHRHTPGATRDAYEEGMIDAVLDGELLGSQREQQAQVEAAARASRPRSPIERMVDQACGVTPR